MAEKHTGIAELEDFVRQSGNVTTISESMNTNKQEGKMKEAFIRVTSDLNEWIDAIFVVSGKTEKAAREIINSALDQWYDEDTTLTYLEYIEGNLRNNYIIYDVYVNLHDE